jgi:hypothetical protein
VDGARAPETIDQLPHLPGRRRVGTRASIPRCGGGGTVNVLDRRPASASGHVDGDDVHRRLDRGQRHLELEAALPQGQVGQRTVADGTSTRRTPAAATRETRPYESWYGAGCWMAEAVALR